MTSKLAQSLRPASFRGVPFHVPDADFSAGRRVQVHQYPQRDKPYVEDIGREAREVTLNAFVIGDDYITAAQRLIAALETAGPGELVHPWLGAMRVSLKERGRVLFDSGLGVARMALAFVEDGGLEFPAAAASSQSATRVAVDTAQSKALAAFASAFNIKGFPDYVEAAARGDLGKLFGLAESGAVPGLDVLRLADRSANALRSCIGFLSAPSSMGLTLLGAFGVGGLVGTVQNWASVARSLAGFAGRGELAPVAVSGNANRQRAGANTNALSAVVRQICITEAAGAATLATADVFDDATALRNTLAAALDAEAGATADDATFEALGALRAALWSDLTARARDSARLVVVTPPDVMPAVVLAYDRYKDAARGDEIATRNRIRNPSFIPAEPLRLLSR